MKGDADIAVTRPEVVDLLRCSECKSRLIALNPGLACNACGESFDYSHDIADFSRGAYCDHFNGPDSLSAEQRVGLENEDAGVRSRIDNYYLPILDSLPRVAANRPIRVLDSGCGNGLSVDLLRSHGIDAWGKDISALRKWQWQMRSCRSHLVVAPSQRLPFPNGYFDAVLSSGVLEHIGVEETGGGNYSVRPLPERDVARVAFLRELVRVVQPRGALFLDFPNGAFPIDFWHGNVPGAARFHSPKEGFLPTVEDVRSYFREIEPVSIQPLSPAGRLQMRQVGSHWYGRAARVPMALFLQLMRYDRTGLLASSALNPYLVLRVQRYSNS